MRDEQQVEFVTRMEIEDPGNRWNYAPNSMINAASHYVDPQWFEDERQALFRAQPLYVGLSVECAIPGTWLTRDLGGVPIAIVRQRDGSLKAFVNACRHRGLTLLSESCTRPVRRIICPYHAWTYNLDGALIDRPKSDGAFDDVDRDCNLIQRAVQEKHGLIYVHPTSNEPFAVDDQLHGMQDEFEQYGIETAHHIETRTSTWNMNWKLLLDTFLEGYHVQFLHQKTIDPIFFPHQFYNAFGPLPRIIGARRSIVEQMTTLPKEQWRLFPHATAVYVLMPNALLMYQGDHIETWRLEPIDANTTRAYTTMFSPGPPQTEKAARYWMKNLEVLWTVATTEDFPAQENVHSNLRSGAVEDVIYGRLEPALIRAHQTVNDAVMKLRAERLAKPDVTPNFHPVAIRASASLLRVSAGEARGCVA